MTHPRDELGLGAAGLLGRFLRDGQGPLARRALAGTQAVGTTPQRLGEDRQEPAKQVLLRGLQQMTARVGFGAYQEITVLTDIEAAAQQAGQPAQRQREAQRRVQGARVG